MLIGLSVVVFGAAIFVAPASASNEVVVVTSFPTELFEGYKKAFEARDEGEAGRGHLLGLVGRCGATVQLGIAPEDILILVT
jgi:hypothetical protein